MCRCRLAGLRRRVEVCPNTLLGEAVFISFFMIVYHVHVLGHGHVLSVVVLVVDLGWRFGSRCGAQRVALLLLCRL